MVTPDQVQAFRSALSSATIVTPLDNGYSEAIKRWNDLNEKKAGVVIFVRNEQDVSVALKLAAEFKLDLAVKGGGHSHWDASSTDGGVVIDLSKMNEVVVDQNKKLARVQGGALWRDVDEALARHGLAAVGGTVNHTGVGGLTLGGGYGWLSGQYGLVIDNLLSARLVLADGRVVEASESSNPELFWAVRGAGHNFGVAVEFVFRTYEQKREVFSGLLLYAIDKAPAVVRFLQKWHTSQTPDENIFVLVSSLPSDPTKLCIGAVPFFNGEESDARRRFSELLQIDPVVNTTTMRPYSTVNGILADASLHGRRKMQRGGVWSPPFTMENLQPVIDLFSEMLSKHPQTRDSVVIIQHDHANQIASVPVEAMSFANRGNYSLMMVEIHSDDPALDSIKEEYATQIINLMKTWGEQRTSKEPGSKLYQNYARGTENPQEIYSTNFERLTRLKREYDPESVFNKYFPIPVKRE